MTRALAVILVCGRHHRVHSTNGLDGGPDEVLLRPLHPPEIAVRLGAVQRLRDYAAEAAKGSRLDGLTGTFNHGYLLERLRHELHRAERYGRSLAVVVIDIDEFKHLNEREGSSRADVVLRELARVLTSRLRGVDLVARTGADEFSVVLPETSLLVARPIAERLRRSAVALTADASPVNGRSDHVTVSLGIAGAPHPEVASVPDLLRCARSALARARSSGTGGNRSVLY